jgi:hypothetical protein
MDNFRRGLLSAVRAYAKTGLIVSVTEIEHQQCLSLIGQFLEPVAYSYVVVWIC